MAEVMLKFTSLDQAYPDKRAAAERRGDFHEIYQEFIAAKAQDQAARCSQCGVPFCQSHCPLQNNIPDWLRLTAEGRLREAYEVSAATNPMPEICGRICPQDRLCEGACVIEQSGHKAVTIGAVEKHLTETAFREGWVAPLEPGPARGRSIGVIGAGPAGLAAAERLRSLGYEVEIYDRYDRAGGLLIYGIPNFKLDKAVVRRRTERLAAGGVRFHLSTEVGRDISFEALRRKHDAVLLAVGVYRARDLEALSGAAKGVIPALQFLTAANRAGLGEKSAGAGLDAKGKKVIVVGGGDTAMDCVRTAVRQGAARVTCVYRRDQANMPGSRAEVGHAQEEGVVFEWLAAPERLVLSARKVSGLSVQRMRLGPPDASGRQSPEPAPGGAFEIEGDLVIKALGFDPEDMHASLGAPELKLTRHGAVRVDPLAMMTSIPGVFAAGDIVRGASLVVWAVREGVDAANGIHAWLKTRAARPETVAAA